MGLISAQELHTKKPYKLDAILLQNPRTPLSFTGSDSSGLLRSEMAPAKGQQFIFGCLLAMLRIQR